ncbi:cell division protein FtsK [Loigolactobacillus backii]|uniref:Cell division protein FtsK n=1 Tax=Loigolactobacillus backii TaxID=375175 RepID=A0A192H548_9LACO|nr:DNA translocase FtsK [Loigolactobacillus backii]ANK60005.1 cell division protein FtsK [Loigolactobacillus backii]ANK63342.1 cell division protein FtsK [Loigolactobacillus backii]ANK64939.1 cell division protein FtsK [Loigolactobacillus backii]ANK66614.1 cell division protein FtsK [Loigolactobacillus backii]ANK69653.1 cell division protein FtsK [Loigolactobacillus backii]
MSGEVLKVGVFVATKKPRRKRTTRKRQSTATRKRKAKKTTRSVNGIGVFFILVSIFAIFKWGFIGNLFANCFRFLGGDTFQFLAALLAIYGLFLLVSGRGPVLPKKRLAGLSLAYLSLLLLLEAQWFIQLNLHSHFWSVAWRFLMADFQKGSVTVTLGGGMTGAALYSLSYFLVAQFGTYIIAGLGLLAGVMLMLDIPFQAITKLLTGLVSGIKHCVQWLISGLQTLIQTIGKIIPSWSTTLRSPQKKSEKPAVMKKAPITADKDLPKPVAQKAADAAPTINVATQQSQQQQATVDPISLAKTTATKEETPAQTLVQPTMTASNYVLPSPDLLQAIPPTDQSDEYQAIKKNSVKLKQTFDSFGIDVEVKNVNLGPAVTKYEIKPAIGVKVSKIVSLTDDLALALAAKDVRIEAPIPGKSLIGIEVPNRQISTVSFRDVIESQPKHPGKPLIVPVGRDISGNVIMIDITKMPHLLIAGATGSGKSVMINDIITAILMAAKPDEVKLMMIDPKKVELSIYNGVPHLITPVVTDAKKAAQALHKVVAEMERRYELFAQFGKRNITEYNQGVQQQNQTADEKQPTMPYIVSIVDELADLMMVASNEVEDAIVRLAQMGRAAGIHMILATQRPSVDVITGLIKANVPSRMAFAVSSGVDSRTIIDSTGAEKLLGRGDMLYLPIDQNKPIRVQGAFIAAKDVEAVVNFIKEQQTAEYDDNMLPDDETKEELDNPDDELFPDAVQLVAKLQTASISMLQRRFRIGYNRAARMIDEMEQRGIVGPSEGSKPRKVYIRDQDDAAKE